MRISGSKVLVTGGAGFIGSHIVDSLVSKGAKVIVFDNMSFGSLENLHQVNKAIEFIEGDILDYDHLVRAMKGIDVVSHHAAQLEIFLGIESPYRDLETNTIGTLNVLRAARKCSVSKVINASSACIYGQVDAKAREDTLPVPNWEYGVSKLAAERYGTIYSTYYNMPVTNLRYSITYGEREWYRRVLTIFIKRAIQNKPLVVFGDGQQVRDFIYVRDAVRLHNLCIENEITNGRSYNAGSGVRTTIKELAHMVCRATEEFLDKKVDIIHENTAEGNFSKLVPDKKRNASELKVMLLDITKASKELNWNIETQLHEGIKRELIWASENLHRWGKIFYSNYER